MNSQEVFEHRILYEALHFILETQKSILDSKQVKYDEEQMDYLLMQTDAVINHDLWKESVIRAEGTVYDKSKA